MHSINSPDSDNALTMPRPRAGAIWTRPSPPRQPARKRAPQAGRWGALHWLILLLLALGLALSSGCAPHRLTIPPTPAIPLALREPCARPPLPDAAALDLAAVLRFGLDVTSQAECERARADAILRAYDPAD